MNGRPQYAQGLERTSGRDMPSSSQSARTLLGGLRSHDDPFRARPCARRSDEWSGTGMETFAERTPDTAAHPDELETAAAPSVPTTDDDDAPVDNPSGG